MKSVTDPELDAFANEVNQPGEQINLARAALVMSRFEYPELNVQGYLERLDRLADAAERAVTTATADLPALVLAEYLFDTLGFAGNAQNYTDPRNSFLNEVLERRLGIPISLSVLYLEVARRTGIAAEGVGLPGHFIVRATLDNGQVVYLDPFHRGALMSEADCRARVSDITDGKLPFDQAFLSPVGGRYILARMLNNLKNFYATSNDYPRAARVVERLMVIHPDDMSEIRNLGLLYGAIGKRRQAMDYLERYLTAQPNAPDADAVKRYLGSLAGEASKWN
jgi:regulator of sirC expression with transglutaminase-like and TPR domain